MHFKTNHAHSLTCFGETGGGLVGGQEPNSVSSFKTSFTYTIQAFLLQQKTYR